jgi:hypothetical protein
VLQGRHPVTFSTRTAVANLDGEKSHRNAIGMSEKAYLESENEDQGHMCSYAARSV